MEEICLDICQTHCVCCKFVFSEAGEAQTEYEQASLQCSQAFVWQVGHKTGPCLVEINPARKHIHDQSPPILKLEAVMVQLHPVIMDGLFQLKVQTPGRRMKSQNTSPQFLDKL